jgi:hypothetical protein
LCIGFCKKDLEEKRPLGRSRHRWEKNIIMNFREIEWDGVDLIALALVL